MNPTSTGPGLCWDLTSTNLPLWRRWKKLRLPPGPLREREAIPLLHSAARLEKRVAQGPGGARFITQHNRKKPSEFQQDELEKKNLAAFFNPRSASQHQATNSRAYAPKRFFAQKNSPRFPKRPAAQTRGFSGRAVKRRYGPPRTARASTTPNASRLAVDFRTYIKAFRRNGALFGNQNKGKQLRENRDRPRLWGPACSQ